MQYKDSFILSGTYIILMCKCILISNLHYLCEIIFLAMTVILIFGETKYVHVCVFLFEMMKPIRTRTQHIIYFTWPCIEMQGIV